MEFVLEKGVVLNIGALDTLNSFQDKLKGKEIFMRVNPDL